MRRSSAALRKVPVERMPRGCSSPGQYCLLGCLCAQALSRWVLWLQQGTGIDLLVIGGFHMQSVVVASVVGLNKGCANQAQTGVIERKRFVSS